MTMPRIRRAGVDDGGRLAALRRADGIERYSLEPDTDSDFEGRFDEWHRQTQESCVSWLATTDAGTVGMLSMFVFPRMPLPERPTGYLAYLSHLFVLPDHRNEGLGRRLLDTALEYARENDVLKILLRPTDQAVTLYHRAGFRTADHYLLWSGGKSS